MKVRGLKAITYLTSSSPEVPIEDQVSVWVNLIQHLHDLLGCRFTLPTSCMELHWQLQLLGQLHKDLQLLALVGDGHAVHMGSPHTLLVSQRIVMDMVMSIITGSGSMYGKLT